MTDYSRYARENEDLEGDYDPNATECETCGVELSNDLVICKPCYAAEQRNETNRRNVPAIQHCWK